MWIFLIHEADGAQKVMESIYVVTTGSGIFLSFASTIFIREKLFSFFKNWDDFANDGK